MNKYDIYGANIAIKQLRDFIQNFEELLEKWEKCSLRDSEMGQEMIRTLKIWKQNAEEEIKQYEQLKETGTFISLQGRNLMKRIRNEKIKDNEDEEVER